MNVKKSISDVVLIALDKSIDGYLGLEDFTYNSHPYAFSGYPRNIKKTTLQQAIRRLKEKGWIDFVDDGKLIIRLTDQGRQRALIESLQQQDQKWDKKWRIVIFDIPEKRRVVRDLLRSRLKQWQFQPWQKSVWVSKASCTRPLRDFIKQVGIEDWVLVIESDNVGF